MVIGPLVFIWLLGLIVWLVPWPPPAERLHEVGRWTFLIAFATWLGLFH